MYDYHRGISRNAPCPCGSGKKFKKCCNRRHPSQRVKRPVGVFGENGKAVLDRSALHGGFARSPGAPELVVGVKYTFETTLCTGEIGYMFAAGRRFLLADGGIVRADELKAGMRFYLEDGVLAAVTAVEPPRPKPARSQARDAHGNHLRTVVGTVKYTGYFPILDLHVNGEKITTTPGHPFWSITRQCWVAAESLQPGEALRTLAGRSVQLETISPTRWDWMDLHNLEVDEYHNYFVGHNGIWAHNGLGMGCSIPQPADPSDVETARLKSVFQRMQDPAEITGLQLQGKSPRQVQAMLPEYNERATNPMHGIFVDSKSGKVYGFQSGLNPGETTSGQLGFRRGLLSNVEIENTTINFITQEAHIEAQLSAFMRKHDITAGTLYINGSRPCLGEFGCGQNLPNMLPPGSRLKVFGMEMEGLYLGQRD